MSRKNYVFTPTTCIGKVQFLVKLFISIFALKVINFCTGNTYCFVALAAEVSYT